MLKRNILWNVGAAGGARLLAPLLQLLVARYLSPEQFAVYAISLAVVLIFDATKDLGVSQSIISRARPVRRLDIDLVFTIQCLHAMLSIAFAWGVMLLARVSEIYVVSILLMMTSLMSNAFVDSGVLYHIKKMDFRVVSLRQLFQPLLMSAFAFVAIILGADELSLPLGYALSYVFLALYFGAVRRDAGRFIRMPKNALKHVLFGLQVILQRLFGLGVLQMDSLISSLYLLPAQIGTYRMAFQLSFIAPNAIFPQVQQVLLSDVSYNRKNVERVERIYYRHSWMAFLFMCVYSLIGYFLAPYLVPVVLGGQWLESVAYIQIYLASMTLGPMCALNNELSKPLGFVQRYTVFSGVRSLSTVFAVFAFVGCGVKWMVFAWCAVGIVSNCVNDLVFFSSQRVVRFRSKKLCQYVVALCFFAFAVNEFLGR